MGQRLPNWTCFSDLVSKEDAAEFFVETYGTAAADAALGCATDAEADGRHDDNLFWLSVSELLTSEGIAEK